MTLTVGKKCLLCLLRFFFRILFDCLLGFKINKVQVNYLKSIKVKLKKNEIKLALLDGHLLNRNKKKTVILREGLLNMSHITQGMKLHMYAESTQIRPR